ncbi:hypothetical protein Scep_009544 [Stephania cephalantha]|uniref:Uncharacterized protein n=1 Tax=Stephania cephalantha TaxID=152367 RepID=A0AAP0JUU2_9MAGN
MALRDLIASRFSQSSSSSILISNHFSEFSSIDDGSSIVVVVEQRRDSEASPLGYAITSSCATSPPT